MARPWKCLDCAVVMVKTTQSDIPVKYLSSSNTANQVKPIQPHPMQGFADARLNDEWSETEPGWSSSTSYPLPQTLHTLSLGLWYGRGLLFLSTAGAFIIPNSIGLPHHASCLLVCELGYPGALLTEYPSALQYGMTMGERQRLVSTIANSH
ncbi:uncharacterized protein BDZ83DRAFT_651563 [Colletotrichum acutatum]|uniref:Uncharacterized protein n=1 Tax=Glomerella acutata TaxID=27357 RepID=A0AAD8UND6_GLOAC|nr:uncharacterized protein BDZ83DRAFT_651563 [Colletotrichum acutatum]KAK1725180.1 hypothetical protein BDZ83DRAFT_651563 [Colletotrichum acutatum]